MDFGTSEKFTAAIAQEQGQALVEYTLILALISIVAIGILTTVGTDVTELLGRVASALESALP
jgi:Flp pilus assembly pilin Flp